MDSLATYLPATILDFLAEEAAAKLLATPLEGPVQPKEPPYTHSYKTCVLFADVSGFTALCEAMTMKYPKGGGDEFLAKHLNSYFELLLRTLSSQGGDVFKFAGDALLVVWPPSAGDDLTTLARRAAQCALEVKQKLTDAKIGLSNDTVSLNIKVGVGIGKINILHVGGVFGRMEYLATGDPLVQAFHAEHQADKKDAVVSPEAWQLCKKYFIAKMVKEKGHEDDPNAPEYAFLESCIEPLRKCSVRNFKTSMNANLLSSDIINRVMNYIPGAVVPWVSTSEEKWASELRRVTVLFVNVGLTEEMLAKISGASDAGFVQRILKAVQLAVYKFEGSLNKFLMDDKGSTLIAVFGLPPLAHENDALRGVMSAQCIITELRKFGLRPAIGISSGMAFCGVVGSRGRREYSVLGDSVNLSARLMQFAGAQKLPLLVDAVTQASAQHNMEFQFYQKITVKGKTKPVATYQPIPQTDNRLFATIGLSPAVFANAVANTRLTALPALIKGGRFLPLPAGVTAAPDSHTEEVTTAQARLFPTSPLLSPAQTVYNVKVSKVNNFVVTVGSNCADNNHVLYSPITLDSAPIQPSGDTTVIPADLCPPRLVPALLEAKTVNQADMGHSARFIASPVQYLQAVDYLRSQNVDGATVESIVPKMESIFVHKHHDLQAETAGDAPTGRFADARFNALNSFCERDETTNAYTVVPVSKAVECDVTTVGDLLRFVASQLNISMKSSGQTVSTEKGVARVQYRQSVASPKGPERKPSVMSKSRSCPVHKDLHSPKTEEICVVTDSAESSPTTASAVLPKQAQKSRFAANKKRITSTVDAVHREAAEEAEKILANTDLVLSLSLTSFGDAALRTLAAQNSILDYRFTHAHSSQAVVLPNSMPLSFLAPLLHSQNARTALFMKQAPGSPNALLCATNGVLSLNISRMSSIDMDTNYICRLRDQLIAYALRCAGHATLLHSPAFNAPSDGSLSSLALRTFPTSASAPESLASPTAMKSFFASPAPVVEAANKGKVVLIESEVGLGKSRLLDLVLDIAVMPTILTSSTPLDVRKLSIISSMVWQLLEQEVAAYEACHAAATLYLEDLEADHDQVAPTLLSGAGKRTMHDAPRMSSIGVSSNISELITNPTKRRGDEPRRSEIPSVPEAAEELSIADLSDEDFDDVISVGEVSVADADNTVADIDPDVLSGRQAALKTGATLRRLVLYSKLVDLFADTTATPQYTDTQIQTAQKDLILLPELPKLSSANIRSYIPIFTDLFPELNFKENDVTRALHPISRRQILCSMVYTWLNWASLYSTVPVPEPAVPVFDRTTQSLLVSSMVDDELSPPEPGNVSPTPSLTQATLMLSPSNSKSRQHTYNPSFSHSHSSSSNRSHLPNAPRQQTLHHGLMIVVDCAVHMDADSWAFLAGLPAAVPHSVLVISTRPVNKLHMGAFVPAVPTGYLDLACDSATVKLNLRARSNAACHQLVMNAIIENELTNNVIPVLARKAMTTVRVPLSFAAAMGKKDVSDKEFINMSIPKYSVTIPNPQKSPLPNAFGLYLSHVGQGNPRVLHEVVVALISADMIRFGTDFVPLELQDTLENYPDIEVDVPVPAPLQSILGSRIDRLNQNQCMFLKVAATIGNVFTFNSVAIAFPLALSSSQLAKELDKLVELQLVKRVPPGSDLYDRLVKSTVNGPFFPEPAEKEALQSLTNTNQGHGFVYDILYGNQDIEATERDYSETVNNYKAEEHRNKAPHFHLDRCADECVYVFRQGFMRDMLLSRMLQEQKTWLVDQIVKEFKVERSKRAVLPLPVTVKLSLQGDRIKAETCLHASTIAAPPMEDGQNKLQFNELVMHANPYGDVIGHNSFHIKKNRQDAQEFKPRYVALHKEWITIWRSEEDFEEYMQFAHQQALNAHALSTVDGMVAASNDTSKLPVAHNGELELVCTCGNGQLASNDAAEEEDSAKQRATRGYLAPFATIDLRHARGELMEADGEFNIVIECGRYMKKGNYHSEKRTFFMNCNSRSMAEQWKIMLDQSCVETTAIANERENKRNMRTQIGRMLRADIEKRVTYNKDEKAQLAEDFCTSLTQRPTGVDVLEADIYVHKRKNGFLFKDDWKRRHIVLTANAVHFREVGNSSGLYTPPSQACALNVGNVRVQHLFDTLAGHPHVLEINVDMWIKGNAVNWKTRSYILSFKSESECEAWFRAVTNVIRSHVIARVEEKYKSMLTLSTEKRAVEETPRPSSPIKRHSVFGPLPTLTNTASAHNRFNNNSSANNTPAMHPEKPRLMSSLSLGVGSPSTPNAATPAFNPEEPVELIDYYNAPKAFMVPSVRLGDHWFTGNPRVKLNEEYRAPASVNVAHTADASYSYYAAVANGEDANIEVLRVKDSSVAGGVSELMMKTLYNDAVLLQRTSETAKFLKQMADVVKDASAAKSADCKVLDTLMTLLNDAGDTLTQATTQHREVMHAVTQTTAPWFMHHQLPFTSVNTLANAGELDQFTLYTPTAADMAESSVAVDLTNVLHVAYENESDDDSALGDDVPASSPSSPPVSLAEHEEVKMFLPVDRDTNLDPASIDTTGMKAEDSPLDLSAVRASIVDIVTESRKLWDEGQQELATKLSQARAQGITHLDIADAIDYDNDFTLVFNRKISDKCGNWNFNILQCTTEELIVVIARLFCAMGLPYTYNIPTDVFANFVIAAYLRYRDNPYHNFMHAVDVTQSVFVILSQWHAYHMFSADERFALMLAAISHDLNHPGTNNIYHVKARTSLSAVFGKVGVLERYHCLSLFNLLADPETNVLVNVSAASTKAIRHMAFQAILSTDMSVHVDMIEKVNLIIQDLRTTHKELTNGLRLNSASPTLAYAPLKPSASKSHNSHTPAATPVDVDTSSPIPPESPSASTPALVEFPPCTLTPRCKGLLTPMHEHLAQELPHLGIFANHVEYTADTPIYLLARNVPLSHKTILLNLVLHAADISNPAKPWSVSKTWATRVVEEFFDQGDIESREGLPVSPNCVREEHKIPGINLQFIDGIVSPLYKGLFRLLPASRSACPNMINNFKQWHHLHQRQLHIDMEQARVNNDKVEYNSIRALRTRLVNRENDFVAEMTEIGHDASSN